MTSFQAVRDKLATLPVSGIVTPVVRDVLAGLVTVVAASTGSGKSMMLPGALADASDHQIIVLAPRRFLAMDAAINVAELAEFKLGEEVGYALGQLDGESSQRSSKTKVLYCTYGYAISSGLINKAKTIVLDEVHEADEQISLARAILRERKTQDPSLRVLEMSATVNAAAQAAYWRPIAQTAIHTVEGQALACDVIHESTMLAGNQERSAEEIVIDLLAQGRKGIVLFRPGVREVENSVLKLKELLIAQGERSVEVVGIHGGTPADERRMARAAPMRGGRKVIVGTNVIESGVNLRWLDSGVSDGYRKIPYRRTDTGADALVQEDLPQSGLLQQIGRINRDPVATGFDRGTFVLHAKQTYETRRLQNGPAIERESLNSIAFYAASLGYDPTQLTWDVVGVAHRAAMQPRFEQAKQELMLLHLIHDDWSLTEEGEFINHLPVSPETGAMLVEAKTLDEQRMRDSGKPPRIMRDAVLVAAIVESHGLRRDTRQGHKSDRHNTSDLIDAMNAFRALRKNPLAQAVLDATEAVIASATPEQLVILQQQRKDLDALCLAKNVSLSGFVEVARLADEITNRLDKLRAGIRVDKRADDEVYDEERYNEIKRCILNAHANRLFLYENEGFRDLLRDYGKQRSEAGSTFNGYELARSSVISAPRQGTLTVGALREVLVKSKDGYQTLLVVTQATVIPLTVFIAWAQARAESHRPIIADSASDDGYFSATYAGKASFEIPMTA